MLLLELDELVELVGLEEEVSAPPQAARPSVAVAAIAKRVPMRLMSGVRHRGARGLVCAAMFPTRR
ncbi:hypothetical protein GCM10009528_34500 [Kineococcus aurantiacus]